MCTHRTEDSKHSPDVRATSAWLHASGEDKGKGEGYDLVDGGQVSQALEDRLSRLLRDPLFDLIDVTHISELPHDILLCKVIRVGRGISGAQRDNWCRRAIDRA